MKTVLVVEDEFGIAELIATALEDEGFQVVNAANGEQALERMAAEPPDLIISDFMMPVMDGPTFATHVKSNPASARIPIIMMSAMPEGRIRERFGGYSAFVQKPFRLSEIIATVREALAGGG